MVGSPTVRVLRIIFRSQLIEQIRQNIKIALT